jgi:hypothetical protein
MALVAEIAVLLQKLPTNVDQALLTFISGVNVSTDIAVRRQCRY